MTHSNQKAPFTQNGNSTPLFIGIAVIAILIGLFVQTGANKPKVLPEFKTTIILPKAKKINYSDFIDHNNNSFNKAQFTGKWSLVFFGFTNCPDICPSTLQTLKQVKADLQVQGLSSNYQTLMITVDPEIDTPERLAKYVPYFDSEFIGLSADIKSTEQFAKQVGVLFIKRDGKDGARYEVDHSASIIVIDPEGNWAGVIGAPHKADEISADLAKLAKFTGIIETSAARQVTQTEKPQAEEVSLSSTEKQSALSLSQAWIRPAPPSSSAMAAYFEIKNNTDKDIQIIDSESPAFDATMIHNTVIENGVAKMVHMDGLTIPANSSVSLAPLSTHMMLMRPEEPLKAGDIVNITLIDENDKQYDYQVEVRQQPIK